MIKEGLLERLFHLKNGIVNYLYIMKKTVKSSMKKYQTGGRTAQNSPGSGRVPTVPTKKPINKTVTKKDGKVIVTYDSKTRTPATQFFGTAPYPATVKKVYDNKGNLISGTKTTKGSYGSSSTERISDPKKKATTTKSSGKVEIAKPKAGSVTTYDGSIKLQGSGKVVKPATGKTGATSTKKPGTGTSPKPTPKPKPAAKTPAKPAASGKTVSQLWTEKTGLPWSEAKKQGMSDGSAASNMALMKKLQTGKPMEYISSGYKIPSEDEARAMDDAYDAAYGPAKTTMRRGGAIKRKMKSKKK
jgi:hypothetical protein